MDEFEKKVKRGKVSYAAAEDILINSYTPQLAADTLCLRGPGRRSSKSGDPLVKCRVNTLYAKFEEGASEATCRPSFIKSRRTFLDPAYHKYFQQTIL